MELFQASEQWRDRPADERFASLADMATVTRQYADASVLASPKWADLRVTPSGEEMVVVGQSGTPAILTHHAFGQLSARAGAPVGYLRGLPATLAAQNINHGLKARGGDEHASLLLHRNGSLVLRAATSRHYARIWNHEVVSRLIDLQGDSDMVPARQTFSWDGQPVPDDAPPSLYASDHDMFAFLMSGETTVTDPAGQSMRRGVMVWNSEVGDKALGMLGFWFRDICANHIVWGAEQIAKVSLIHRGAIAERWMDATIEVRRYLNSATSLESDRFAATTRRIAASKEDVLDTLFARKVASRSVLGASFDAVIPTYDGDPLSVWGMAQGMTRFSQSLSYADERVSVDRAASKVLEMAESF
jgi:hypothetical protein